MKKDDNRYTCQLTQKVTEEGQIAFKTNLKEVFDVITVERAIVPKKNDWNLKFFPSIEDDLSNVTCVSYYIE